MKLTPEQGASLVQKMSQLWKPPQQVCPVCQTSQWQLADTVYELREFQGGNLVIGGNTSIYPVIPATCANCGNTIFFNAVVLGIIPPGSPEKKGGQQ